MEQKDYRLAAILYTDIAGFSRMMEKDEAATLRLLGYHNELIGEIVGRHHGTIVKTIGDALLIDFKNTVEALQSAMEIQDKLYAYNQDHAQLPLLVRIGLHLGDIYFFENDALGEGINIAARLQSLAKPGCICFSQDVYNLVLNKIEFRADKLGKVSLKNITKEIHAYEIASPNIEFDPDHGKPRPGYQAGSYLGEAEGGASGEAEGGGPRGVGRGSPAGTASAERTPPPQATRGAGGAEPGSVDRSYTEEGSRSILAEIRRAILQDTKAMGRRLSVDEARARYRYYGVEAEEVIAAMAEQGLLTRAAARPGSGGPAGQGGAQEGFGRFGGPAGSGAGPGGFGAQGGFGGPGGFGGFGAPGGFDGRALGQNIRAAVEGIVGEIQRNVAENVERAKAEGYDSGSYYRDKYERHIERHRRRMQRHELRHGSKHEDAEDDEQMNRRERSASTFEEYRNILETRAHRQRGGLWGHLSSYLAVNAVLWYINLHASPHGFLWAAIVSAGWGIGLLSSFASVLRSGAKLREIEAMPELEGQSLQDYKRLNKVRDSLAMHAASTVGVSALFGVLQALILGTASFWLLIPVGAMLVGFISHLASYAAVEPRLKKKLLSVLGISGGWRNIFRLGKARKKADAGLGPYAALYREAESTTDAIVEQLRSGKAGPMEDMVPSLKEYVDQVRLLAGSANEIDRLVEAIPAAALGKDREALAAKAAQATSEPLKSEYRSSIAEIEKQEKAYQELKEQSEVVRLRLGSSVNQLKQMRIDIARISAAPGLGEGPNLDQFKRRTEELSRYLEDLRTSFDAERGAEGDDPFAELERLERERLEREAQERSPKGELGGSAL